VQTVKTGLCCHAGIAVVTLLSQAKLSSPKVESKRLVHANVYALSRIALRCGVIFIRLLQHGCAVYSVYWGATS